MPGFNPDNINIHDLTIEEPEKQMELPFDMERDITKQDYHEMHVTLEGTRMRAKKDRLSWLAFSEQAMAMKVLYPDKVNELRLQESDYEGMKGYVEAWRTGAEPKIYIDLSKIVLAIKILWPEKMEEMDADGNLWRDTLIDLHNAKNSVATEKMMTFSQKAVQMKILFPEKVEDLNIDGNTWQEMKKFLEGLHNKPFLEQFAKLAMRMKILCPEKASELDTDEAAWIGMGKILEFHRAKKDWGRFAEQAEAMKIIAAEEVKVTDKGLEVNMRKPELTESETLKIPDQRKF